MADVPLLPPRTLPGVPARNGPRRTGIVLLVLAAGAAVFAPWLAPNPPAARFPDHAYAPPTRIRVFDGHGAAPHIHAVRLESRVERRFEETPDSPVRLHWFDDRRLLTADPAARTPLLLLGADSFGRDAFSRLLHGARVTLALAAAATLAAVLLGGVLGAWSGYAGGVADDVLSRGMEFLLVLPTIYVALAARAALPLVPGAASVFVLLTAVFAVLGMPIVARGVRAIVASERARPYAEAARAAGASPARVVTRHLLPACRGYLAAQAAILLPSFILAEATLTYVGLGFPDGTTTWGTLLQETSRAALFGDTPWALAPAVAMFVVVLAVQLAAAGRSADPWVLSR